MGIMIDFYKRKKRKIGGIFDDNILRKRKKIKHLSVAKYPTIIFTSSATINQGTYKEMKEIFG